MLRGRYELLGIGVLPGRGRSQPWHADELQPIIGSRMTLATMSNTVRTFAFMGTRPSILLCRSSSQRRRRRRTVHEERWRATVLWPGAGKERRISRPETAFPVAVVGWRGLLRYRMMIERPEPPLPALKAR
jgi:hypothetical protein